MFPIFIERSPVRFIPRRAFLELSWLQSPR
jgi:hypothetical protein